jgi:translocation and assembly module TamB
MRHAALMALCLAATPLSAQEDDRDFLTAFLEDSLSGAGREVTITGFAGALSARATIDQLTIADDQGIWLTVNGATLDWSRSAILSGEVRVSDLSAQEIIVARLPSRAETAAGLPDPEAKPFSLPELPVSIDIDRVAAGRIELGEGILGQPFEGTLSAALSLAGGDGAATLQLSRTDQGPGARVDLSASYSNATRELVLSLDAAEEAGGIVVGLLGIPGAPSAEFQLAGQGPLEDHRATIRLATDGEDRLAGTVELGQEADGGYRLQADVAGNIAPILAPDQVGFFGTDIGLTLDAARTTTGRVLVDRLSLRARSLRLDGRAEIAADGLPEALDITGILADPDGTPVLLPFGDSPTRLGRAEFSLSGGFAADTGWRGKIALADLTQEAIDIAALSLSGSGRLGRADGRSTVGGTIQFQATGLDPSDPALAEAVGKDLQGGFRFHWLEGGGTVDLNGITLAGDGMAAGGALRIEGLETGLLTSGDLRLEAADLSRFSALANRPLGGAGTLSVKGSVGLLSGTLDAVADLAANGLSVAIPEVDGLLRGPSTARISVLRDESGTSLRALDLAAGALTATASGKLATAGSTLAAEVALNDLSALGSAYGGRAGLKLGFDGTPQSGRLTLDGTAASLRIGNPAADRILAGNSTLSARIGLRDGAIEVDQARLGNPQVSLEVTGRLEGAVRKLAIDARLANLGLVLPDLQGPLTLSGSASQDASGYAADLSYRGPAGISGTVKGTVAPSLTRADLALEGVGRATLTNLFISPRALDGQVRYDLALDGPLRLSSITGRVTLSDGRFSDPDLGASLEGIEALAQLQAGKAAVSATARLSTGGRIRVDGPIGLEPPFPARLAISLDRLRLIDPELYEVILGGALTLDGPLGGGALIAGSVQLEQAELRVPESGFAGASDLGNLRHVHEPGPVHDTRVRAGLVEAASGSGAGGGAAARARPYGLDLTISAPARVFVRGRGIDAELGGQIRLAGTTDAVIPSGQFNLIRGRLDILGKRLVISEAELDLAGRFVPNVRFVAENQGKDVVSRVTVEGPADDPEITFSSVPQLPEEEVLAQLLFGRDLGRISALQAAQLANAVAVLAGRGGEGIVSRLRNSFGLADLDVTTTEDGETALTAGRYLTENIYSEIQTGQGGSTSLTLNFDFRDGVTARARVEDDGDSGLGIFIQRDY